MNKKKVIALSALSIAIATPAIIVPLDGPAYEVEAATYKKIFKDVTKVNQNYDIIHQMAHDNIIKGYSDNTFRGGNTITRYQVAALVYRYLGNTLEVVNPNVAIPSDVSPKSEHYKATVALLKAGLLQANESGKLNPNKPITRAEMAKVLVKAFDVKIKADYDFADTIDGDEETRDYVRALYSNGITTGYLSDATFRPEKSLTRQQFAVFMHRSINIDPEFEAPPIVIPGTDDTPKDDTPKEDTPNYEEVPKTEGYDRYASNFDLTPLSEIESMPTERETLTKHDTYLNAVYNPKVTGMTLEEHTAYATELLAKYKAHIKVSFTGSVNPIFFGMEEFWEGNKKFFNNSKEQMAKAFYYTQKTGAVYKGEKVVITWRYVEGGKGGYFTMSTNSR